MEPREARRPHAVADGCSAGPAHIASRQSSMVMRKARSKISCRSDSPIHQAVPNKAAI